MDILVTGASGFLGRNFLLSAPDSWRILALYRNDDSFPDFVAGLNRPGITAVHCDLSSQAEIAALIERFGRDWEHCVYLAAKVDIPWSVREPGGDLEANVVPLLNLLDHIRVRRFIYFSSGAVYDGLEGEVRPDLALSPTLPYAISKLAAERYVECYARRKRFIDEFVIVRFFGAYGPYEAPHKIYTRLIRAFAFERRAEYSIYGDGRNIIDAMYVDDAVAAIWKILGGSPSNCIVNLAAGTPLSIEALVTSVAQALGIESPHIQKEGIAHESNLFWGSTAATRDLFGFSPQISLASGIRLFRRFLETGDSVTVRLWPAPPGPSTYCPT